MDGQCGSAKGIEGGINAMMDGARQADGWVVGGMVREEDVLMGQTGGRRGEWSI